MTLSAPLLFIALLATAVVLLSLLYAALCRADTRAYEVEANEAADEVTHARTTINSLRQELDRHREASRLLVEQERHVAAWNARHPTRACSDVREFWENAWLRNAKGQLERAVRTDG